MQEKRRIQRGIKGDVMDRTEKCRQKFKKLFGGEPVNNEGSDPEFMRILQRFIFGEVSYTGTLDDRLRELVTITVLTVNGTLPQLSAHVGACLNVGLSPIEIREAVYQCAPFVGFPKTLNAISAMNGVFAERGISLPLDNCERVTEEDRLSRGAAVQSPLYGDEIAEKYSRLPEPFNKAVPLFLTELCFGDFATRRGLDGKTRELLNVVMLAAMGGAEVQVRAHIRGALRAGNTAEEIVCALVHAMPYMGIPRLFNALNCGEGLLY